MKKSLITKFLVTIHLMVLTACGEIETKISVTDEKGNPIEDAEVQVIFQAYQSKNDEYVVETTNKDGAVILRGRAEAGVRLMVSRDGYYSSEIKDLSPNADLDLKIRLRIKKDPIPLFAKKIILRMPVAEKWVGFDLEKAEFTAPYGNGKFSDLRFRMSSIKTTNNGLVSTSGQGKLEFSFSEEHDGFLFEEEGFLSNSRLKMPHIAPEYGYQKLLVRNEKSYTNSNVKLNAGMFFRVRSVVDEDGSLESANYGKFASDLQYDPRESGWHVSHKNKPKNFGTISFVYYFNPQVNDRNLEFDPSRNLFSNLSRDEQVFAP